MEKNASDFVPELNAFRFNGKDQIEWIALNNTSSARKSLDLNLKTVNGKSCFAKAFYFVSILNSKLKHFPMLLVFFSSHPFNRRAAKFSLQIVRLRFVGSKN